MFSYNQGSTSEWRPEGRSQGVITLLRYCCIAQTQTHTAMHSVASACLDCSIFISATRGQSDCRRSSSMLELWQQVSRPINQELLFLKVCELACVDMGADLRYAVPLQPSVESIAQSDGGLD